MVDAPETFGAGLDPLGPLGSLQRCSPMLMIHCRQVTQMFIVFFTARHYASAVYAVCVSVTLLYCIKTAKLRITPIMPHDSPGTLVFWCQRSRRNSNGITPYGWSPS